MNAGNSPSTWMKNRGTLKHPSVSGRSWMKDRGHVMRYAAAGMLEEAGCTVGEITSVIGHRTYQMAMKYLTARRNSAAAIARLNQRA